MRELYGQVEGESASPEGSDGETRGTGISPVRTHDMGHS